MSYRTLKRLLGETSLERKCRLLFGTGLLLLIAGSFALYGWLTVRLVYEQKADQARSLVRRVVYDWHVQKLGADAGLQKVKAFPSGGADDETGKFFSKLYSFRADPASELRLSDQVSIDAQDRFQSSEDTEFVVIADGPDGEEYDLFVPLVATGNCRNCHHAGRTYHADVAKGDLLGMARVTIPLDRTRQAMARNNAFLITTAIATAVLAMAAAWAIVRYVIVKPVLHLKDVSDEIAKGTLDLRADIRTGDEFEELSHAFNRMLRHLITMQEEMGEKNAEIEGKVDELARVNLRLYETNKLKDEFLATMSHELRTPLNSILGFSDVLAGAENLTDKQKRFLDNIRKSGRDLLLLINDVLDLAKIESGRLEVQPADVRLIDVVDKQVDSMLPMAERKNIDLTTSVDLDMPVLHQDPGKLQQILTNLLSNALKFTPEGGRVRVRGVLLDDGRRFELVVEDTGIGIPLEDQAAVFEKFRQGRSVPGQRDAMTREYGGTGLGLSIVKELARLLGGEISLESEFGKGSTFRVRLPIRVEDAYARHDEPRRPLPRTRSEAVIVRPSEGATL